MLVLTLSEAVGVFILGADQYTLGVDRYFTVVGYAEPERSPTRLGFTADPQVVIIRFDVALDMIEELLRSVTSALEGSHDTESTVLAAAGAQRDALRYGSRVLRNSASTPNDVYTAFRHPLLMEVLESYAPGKKVKQE
ncbi:MAG: hypothetical protein PHH13_04370 [Candidatus Peribacteraceae bacterium]|nr:hypothetical protein [Candidatus Peribacteraceae bacterium]